LGHDCPVLLVEACATAAAGLFACGGSGVFINSSARRRTDMHLTGGIQMTEKRWRLLDLLGILLVAGTATGIIAI
jgi:hypothetical protein